jgi:hypothetical protein
MPEGTATAGAGRHLPHPGSAWTIDGSNNERAKMSKDQRDGHGRFLPGCKGGPGNPNLRKLAVWKEALVRAISAKDIREIVRALLKEAKNGSIPAAVEILNRTIGKAAPDDLAAEITELGNMILELQQHERHTG